MIEKIVIYGERCSGTNYLQELLGLNFINIKITWEYGNKHFFGFYDYETIENMENILFLSIVREFGEWSNSLFRNPYYLSYTLRNDVNKFLNDVFFSFNDEFYKGQTTLEIMEDRHIETKERYKNIFELRDTKLKFLVDDLPKKVKNCILIRYEDLVNDFENTMNKIQNCGLEIKDGIQYPLNTDNYKNLSHVKFSEKKKKQKNVFTKEEIYENPNFKPCYEKKIGYVDIVVRNNSNIFDIEYMI
jgi:hypothetical protein